MSAPILYHENEGWRLHATSRCPVNAEAIVRVQFKGGHVSQREYPAGKLKWEQRGNPFDIAAYQVVKEAGQ